MEPVAAPDGADIPPQTRPKRSRTGCLTCRTRRRKCDEGKPNCQNCVDKGLQCQYPATFQILGRNNFTPVPEVQTSVKYTNLTFVSDEHENKSNKAETPSEDKNDGLCQIIHFSPETTLKGSEVQDHSHIRNASSELSPSAPTDNYEFALHGLLALGGANTVVRSDEVGISPGVVPVVSPTSAPRIESGVTFSPPVPGSFDRGTSVNDNSAVQLWQSTELTCQDPVPQERVLELLKYFRYEIAPFLDIGASIQCFGGEVLQMSTESNLIRLELLTLAEASVSTHEPQEIRGFDIGTGVLQHGKVESDILENALLSALEIVRRAISHLDNFWYYAESTSISNEAVEMAASLLDQRLLASAIFWLLARLQLSIGLASASPEDINFHFMPMTPYAARICIGEGDSLQFSHRAVALCTDIFVFCKSDDDKHIERLYGRNRVDAWATMVRMCEEMYNCRLQDLQAVVELYPVDGNNAEDEFPTLVFTSGAAILVNQLCHTGMMLLLQSKPRFATQRSSSSPFMSAMWHSRRVCGISMNNDRRECWDPCLLASFLLAARTATARAQHNAIIRTAECIQNLTGWNIRHHLETLREEWRLAEGW